MKGIDLGKSGAKAQIRKILQKAVRESFVSAVRQYAPKVVEAADENREFVQFTGNTVSSYAAGVYDNGELVGTVSDGTAPVVHDKIEKGETVRLNNPVEGWPREVVGAVDIAVRPHGMDLSRQQLSDTKPRGGAGMVVTTGTEYSGYLEKECDLDVLTDTYNQVRNSARSELQRIIDGKSR